MKEVERVARAYEELISEVSIGICELIGWQGEVSKDTELATKKAKAKVERIRKRYLPNK